MEPFLLRPCLYGLGYPRQPFPSRQLYGAFIWSCGCQVLSSFPSTWPNITPYKHWQFFFRMETLLSFFHSLPSILFKFQWRNSPRGGYITNGNKFNPNHDGAKTSPVIFHFKFLLAVLSSSCFWAGSVLESTLSPRKWILQKCSKQQCLQVK